MTDQLTTRRRLPLLARGRTVPENSGAPTEFDTSTDFIGLTMLLSAMVALGVFVSWSWTFIVAFIVFMLFMHEMGPLRYGEVDGYEGRRVLHWIRSPTVVVPPWRYDFWCEGDSGGRVYPHHRDEQSRHSRA